MKIAFIALALVFSMAVHAGEIPQTDGATESATDDQARDERLRIALEEKNKDREATKREENRIREQERQATKPVCDNILFTGIASDPSDGNLIEKTIASRDIEGTLTRNPFECSKLDSGGQAKCTGLAFLRNQKGKIVSWNKEHYFIYTTLKFESGRKTMVGLAIRRQDAVCAN